MKKPCGLQDRATDANTHFITHKGGIWPLPLPFPLDPHPADLTLECASPWRISGNMGAAEAQSAPCLRCSECKGTHKVYQGLWQYDELLPGSCFLHGEVLLDALLGPYLTMFCQTHGENSTYLARLLADYCLLYRHALFFEHIRIQ